MKSAGFELLSFLYIMGAATNNFQFLASASSFKNFEDVVHSWR